jgi:tRNA pseudouridine38-40 synthase
LSFFVSFGIYLEHIFLVRLKITIAYDGRLFEGSQSQPSGNTIQDFLEKALENTAKQSVKIHLSGRTDAGVHASGQIAHFDIPDNITMNPYNWVPALNVKLPPSLRVMSCEEVVPDFHARFLAIGKTYQYQICTLPVLPPLMAGLAWHIPKLFDADILGKALKCYLGRHDFRSFAAVRGNEKFDTDYYRTISQSFLDATDDGYTLTFTGEGFFYKMVRLLTGTAIATAQGKISLESLESFVDPGDVPFSNTIHYCAPPDGLTLIKVHYN